MICFDSVQKYCRDSISSIENYELANNDKSQMWICHHRLEEFYSCEELKHLGIYYNVPPEALIFLTRSQHQQQPHYAMIKAIKEGRSYPRPTIKDSYYTNH